MLSLKYTSILLILKLNKFIYHIIFWGAPLPPRCYSSTVWDSIWHDRDPRHQVDWLKGGCMECHDTVRPPAFAPNKWEASLQDPCRFTFLNHHLQVWGLYDIYIYNYIQTLHKYIYICPYIYWHSIWESNSIPFKQTTAFGPWLVTSHFVSG